MTRTGGTDGGFTLVELLLAIVILGVIIAPLTAGLIEGLKTTGNTAAVLVTSSDRQLVTTYLQRDIQSASMVDTAPGTLTGCAGASPGNNVLHLQWNEWLGVTTTYVADYRIVPFGSPPIGQIVRYACTAGGAAQVNFVARDLLDATAASASVVVTGTTVSLTLTDALQQQYTVSSSRRSP